YVEGHNILIEYRWHEGKVDRLPALARRTGEPQAGSDPRVGVATDLSSQSGDHHGAHRLRGQRRPGRSGVRLKSRAPRGKPDRARHTGAGEIRGKTGATA